MADRLSWRQRLGLWIAGEQTSGREAVRLHHNMVLARLDLMIWRRERGGGCLPYEVAQLEGLIAARAELQEVTLPRRP